MTDPEKFIASWIDGSLTEDEQAALDEWLKSDDEHLRRFTDAVMFEQQIQSAVIAGEEHIAAASFNSHSVRTPRSTVITRRTSLAIAAALIAMLTLAFWPRYPADQTFATLEQSRAAFWESGDFSTADGSRLGQGTLRLAEGLATLKFDSGAEVVLEAPATLILADAMNCELTRGTVVSDVPKSAKGFRIMTPSADVVDYGTRFAVSVYEETGETHTQVIEGRVQVEHQQSNKVVELRTGQSNTVLGESMGSAQEGANHEYRNTSLVPVEYGPEWTLLDSAKDAYTGRVKDHESEVLLYVKNGRWGEKSNRTSYIGFDLDDIDQGRIEEAELLLYFAPTGWGLASIVPHATFSVYGMTGEVPDWDDSILYDRFPGEPEVVHLGSFTIPQGVQKGRFSIRSNALTAFLTQHTRSDITLKVVRDTKETASNGLVHGFASRRHPFLPAPTLAIRETSR